MVENLKPIDETILIAELRQKNLVEKCGGIEYIGEIITSVPTANHIDAYINIVNDCALRRKLINEATEIISSAHDGESDIRDILDESERKILGVVKARKGGDFKSIQDVMTRTQADIEELFKNPDSVKGLSTGFKQLDQLTNGFHEHELIIIAARPAMGKTAFALNLTINMAKSTPKAVALFNMEMGDTQLMRRMFASEGGIQQNVLKNGKLETEDWTKLNFAIERLGNTNIYIDDTSGQMVSDIKRKCRKLAASERGLSAVVIDYLTLIQGSPKYQGNRQQEVSEISRSLKTLAMELDITVIALAQLSRAVETRDDKRPMLSDLRESGSIEQDADIVAFLYREDYYQNKALGVSDRNPISESEFIVAKHRSGDTATIPLTFRKDISRFEDKE